jgi:protein-tyrosine phosphatase
METIVLRIDSLEPDLEILREAASVVRNGGLVGFATETVYGIACRVGRDSLGRLDAIKGRSPDKPYTLHIGDRDEVSKYVPKVSLREQKLMTSMWPGPLTIVFELENADLESQRGKLGEEPFDGLYSGNSIGIRCPENRVASRLLSEAGCAVVAPSANRGGADPAVTADKVLEQLDGELEMVLDSGPCRYKHSSTVVRMNITGPEVLREGIYSLAEIDAASEVRFLFVCSGNTCRSPMAEGMFRKYLSEKLGCEVDRLDEFGYKIASAGTFGIVGVAASGESVVACGVKGIDISTHRSRAVDVDLIEASDYIFVMGKGHSNYISSICPEAVNKCRLLLDQADVPDPIGQPQVIYDECANMIETAVRTIIGGLKI